MTTHTAQRTVAQLHEHYEVEKELANRLRSATKTERRHLYNVVYDERLQRIPHHPLLTKAQDDKARMAAVVPQLRLLQPFLTPKTLFLEVGPGDCALAFEVAKQVKKVYAVDVSDGLVQGSDRPANFELHLSDGIQVPAPANRIDLAYSSQLMEHLHPEDAHEQLVNIYNALKPGGHYICITPNRLSGPWDISRYFDSAATGFHLKEYTLTDLAATFRAAGFRKARAFVTYQGHRLSPILPVLPFSWVEWSLERLPRKVSWKPAQLLTAVKIMATK